MTIQEFSKEKNISTNKAVKMAPHIEGSTQCPCCKKWIFPNTAKAIYIPDKRKYTTFSRPYCYVIDAIALDMELNPAISAITEQNARTVVRELYDNGLIILKENCDRGSLYHLDYMLSIQLLEWQTKSSQEKSKLICQTIQSCANAIAQTAEAIKNYASTH